MDLRITIHAKTVDAENIFVNQLSACLHGFMGIEVESLRQVKVPSQVVFLDSKIIDLEKTVHTFKEKNCVVVLLVTEGDHVPSLFLEGKADDVLVYPFRSMEVFSKLKAVQSSLNWHQVSDLNSAYQDTITKLRADLELVEKLHKAKFPNRLSKVKGLDVKSRYLAGTKPGGDFFDLIEANNSSSVSFFLSDVSSYGLSTALLTTMMDQQVRWSKSTDMNCENGLQPLWKDIQPSFQDGDSLSLFFGLLNRKNFRLKYVNFGSSVGFVGSPGQSFEPLENHRDCLSKKDSLSGISESEVRLTPKDRLVLVSDGFIESCGGMQKTKELLDRYSSKDSSDLLNELVYVVKARLGDLDQLPSQDCTAVVADVDKSTLRIA